MKNTVATVAFSLLATGCAFYAMVYPAWFQQHYHRDGKDVFQGYGIFAFYSTGTLESPFYASATTLQYSDFCKSTSTPNYMLGDGANFHIVLCGKAMHSIQATTATGAAVSVVGLIMSVMAVYNPTAGISERAVSIATLVGSILLAVSLVIWGWAIQQRLYEVDTINSAFNTCKADRRQWSCWFYGYSFWVCLAAVIVMSITGYLSSAGRAEKIRYFRKEYERDLEVAMQQSLEHDTAVQAQHGTGPTPHGGFARANTGNFLPPTMQQHQPYSYAQPHQASPYGHSLDHGHMPSAPPLQPSVNNPMQQHETAFPAFREERKNQSLLGRQASGGVV